MLSHILRCNIQISTVPQIDYTQCQPWSVSIVCYLNKPAITAHFPAAGCTVFMIILASMLLSSQQYPSSFHFVINHGIYQLQTYLINSTKILPETLSYYFLLFPKNIRVCNFSYKLAKLSKVCIAKVRPALVLIYYNIRSLLHYIDEELQQRY